MALQSINPATGETLQTFDTLAPAEVAGPSRARNRRVSSVEEHVVRRAGAVADCVPPASSKANRKRSGG